MADMLGPVMGEPVSKVIGRLVIGQNWAAESAPACDIRDSGSRIKAVAEEF
jgi:hypothetical protein